ncbi:transmembrane protein 248-like [Euwallacea fornicatus]|uniref:transmembrane protein 248-like n=1 Tax=Euwallacea fornicatus TaxID=995702 RepID=UPI00339051CB
MASTPVKNLTEFFETRPPLGVILVCIGFLVICTIYYVALIKQDEPLVSSDKKHDWIQMVKHFNHLDICLNTSTWSDEINFLEIEENFRDIMTVYTKVTIINPEVLQGLSQVSGSLSLDEWYPTSCPDVMKPKTMGIIFDVPLLKSNVTGPLEICVSLKGSARFLPSFKKPLCFPAANNGNTNVNKGYLSSKLPKYFDEQFCSNGYKAKMEFNLTVPNIKNYLSDDVRTQIYIHLIMFEYFLVFLVILILIYAMFKHSARAEYLEKKNQTARLL